MRSLLLSIFLTTASVLALSACGGGSGKIADPVEEDYEHGPFLGDLDKKLAEIYGKDREIFFEPCDFQNRRKIFEIGKELEKRRGQLSLFNEGKREAAKDDYLKFGEFQFAKSKPKAAEDKWSEWEWSWTELIRQYEYIKTHPSDEYWDWLNSAVRGVVADDDDRLNGFFKGAKRSSGPMAAALNEVITACDANEDCTNPPFTSEQKEFLNNSGVFRFYWKDLESSTYAREDKRSDIKFLKKRIGSIAKLYDFGAYEAAHVDGQTLVIPMDLSVFGAGADDAIKQMQEPWNIDSTYKVRIENVAKSDKTFKILVSDVLGERAFVSRSEFLMQLYNYGGLQTLSHEFGHILGFQDNYFTSWDKVSCKYKVEANSGDLMSASSSGKVLPSHWEKLKKIYFSRSTEKPEASESTDKPQAAGSIEKPQAMGWAISPSSSLLAGTSAAKE